MNEVRKSNRSPANRIQSILEDSNYVASVKSVYNRPLVANMRCGLWYVPPRLLDEKCYFKSTDGHTHQWQFSQKRLNLHLVDLIETTNGCIIVDSTRRGKTMPDALSKTVPIWCAVLNCALLGLPVDEALYLPKCVSPSEQDQIAGLIEEWVNQFNAIVPESLRPRLSKKLRPLYVSQQSMLPDCEFRTDEEILAGAHPIILCSASKQAQDGEIQMPMYVYVQGAADDHELWAPAEFSAQMLWDHTDLHDPALGDAELLRHMQDAVDSAAAAAGAETTDSSGSQLVYAMPQLYIGSTRNAVPSNYRVIDLRSRSAAAVSEKSSTQSAHSGRSSNCSQSGKHDTDSNYAYFALPKGKRGSRELAQQLSAICKFFEADVLRKFAILSDAGTDFAACVALMLNCRYFDSTGMVRNTAATYVSKDEVTRRNAILIAHTGCIPSRITQNVVGNFLRA